MTVNTSEIGAFINAQTEDTSPDPSADFLLEYDASAAGIKKVKMQAVASITGTAPTDALYVVGAANSTLTNELVVSVPSAGGVIPKIIWKTSDETVNNSSVLQNDDELVLPVLANEIWFVVIFVLTNSNSTADIKFDFTVPSGASFTPWSVGPRADQTVDYSGSGTRPLAGFSANVPYQFQGIYIGGANAGNLQTQWAQNTANGSDTKVLTGSCLIGYKKP